MTGTWWAQGCFPHCTPFVSFAQGLFVNASSCCQQEGKSFTAFLFACCMCSHSYRETERCRAAESTGREEQVILMRVCWHQHTKTHRACRAGALCSVSRPGSAGPFTYTLSMMGFQEQSRAPQSEHVGRLCHFFNEFLSASPVLPDLCYQPLPGAGLLQAQKLPNPLHLCDIFPRIYFQQRVQQCIQA